MANPLVDAETRFIAFGLAVVLFAVIILGWQIDRRTDAIATIQQSADTIQEAATNTERLLTEVVEADRSPEAEEQRQAVRRALSEIRDIKTLLCSVEQLAAAEECG